MKFKIVFYLFLFVCVILFFQLINTNKILNHQDRLIQSQNSLQLRLKDSISNLKNDLGNLGENKLLLITAVKIMDEYYETKKKVDQRKNEFKDLSNKFKELKSLIYEYRDKKEDEIKKLNLNHEDFKIEIENNQKKYEQLIDEAADQISNFVKKAKIDNLSQ